MDRYCKRCRRTKSLHEFERNSKYQLYEDKSPYREIIDHNNYDKSFQRQCRECNVKVLWKRKHNRINLILLNQVLTR